MIFGVSATHNDGALAVRGEPTGPGRRSLSIDEAAVQLTRSGLSWSPSPGQPVTVTYGFRASAPGAGYDPIPGFSQFSSAQIVAAELMLAGWSDVAGITFVRAGPGGYTDSAEILFANFSNATSPAAAFAYLPGPNRGGDVWVNAALSYNQAPEHLGYGYFTLAHEIGHAIGLSHPGDYNAGEGKSITYQASAGYREDSNQYTLMSYFSEYATGASYAGYFASAPLLDDIAAAQRLYGANMTTRTGDTVYGFNSTAGRSWFEASAIGGEIPVIFAVWDAGGVDTLDFSGYAQNGIVDLRQGRFSSVGGLSGNVSIAVGAIIENAIGGSGRDVLIGNGSDNAMRGGAGDDEIDGGAGMDTAIFFGAMSAYTVTAGTEVYDGITYGVVRVIGPNGSDALRNVEILRFDDGTMAVPAAVAGTRLEGDLLDNLLTGTAFADRLVGDDGDDELQGGVGDDILVGDLGIDILNGGAGNDTADYSAAWNGLLIDLDDGTTDVGAFGQDQLIDIESVTGGVHDDVLRGDSEANTLRGGGGADHLVGRGGDDVLVAGNGRFVAAPDVVKTTENNTSRATAISLEGAFDQINANEAYTHDPVAVVRAQAGGNGAEYYSIVVTADMARYRATIDILAADFDAVIRIFDSAGNVVAQDDDWTDLDPHVSHMWGTAGTYYIEVSRYLSGDEGDGDLQTQSPPAGAGYVLQVTAPRHDFTAYVERGSVLDGGDGDDTLHGGTGDDVLNGGAGDDVIHAAGLNRLNGVSTNAIDGGEGRDRVVYAGSVADYDFTYDATTGIVVRRSSQTDTLLNIEILSFSDFDLNVEGGWSNGTAAADVLDGGAAGEIILGLAGDDTIRGGAGDDALFGGAGRDLLDGGEGADLMHGGTSPDIFIVDNVGDHVIGGGASAGTGDRVRASIDYVLEGGVTELEMLTGAIVGTGASTADKIFGNAANNRLYGEGGNDWIDGGAGNDRIEGGGGFDQLFGGDGDDILRADGPGGAGPLGVSGAVMVGGSGADQMYGSVGGDGFEYLAITDSRISNPDIIRNFMTGDDSINLEGVHAFSVEIEQSGGWTNIYFAPGENGYRGLIRVETSYFAPNDIDTNFQVGVIFRGDDDQADYIEGTGQDDQLFGRGGNDTLHGGYGGNDILTGGAGADTFYIIVPWGNYVPEDQDLITDFETGVDNLTFHEPAAVTITRTETGAMVHFGKTQFTSREALEVNGVVQGSDIVNYAGGVTLIGTTSADVLIGSAGKDLIVGSGGADQMTGGAGGDRFVIRAQDSKALDEIMDFQTGVDRLEVPVEAAYLLRFSTVGDATRIDWLGGAVLVHGAISMSDIDFGPLVGGYSGGEAEPLVLVGPASDKPEIGPLVLEGHAPVTSELEPLVLPGTGPLKPDPDLQPAVEDGMVWTDRDASSWLASGSGGRPMDWLV